MASGTWTTTAEEDAAILALPREIPETVAQFIDRHIRHQVAHAVEQQRAGRREDTRAAYDRAPIAVQDQVDTLLDPFKPKP